MDRPVDIRSLNTGSEQWKQKILIGDDDDDDIDEDKEDDDDDDWGSGPPPPHNKLRASSKYFRQQGTGAKKILNWKTFLKKNLNWKILTWKNSFQSFSIEEEANLTETLC